MKALVFGGGSKWGYHFTKALKVFGYEPTIVTSSTSDLACKKVLVNWKNLKTADYILEHAHETYDLIFFNQNCPGAPNADVFSKEGSFFLDSWKQSHWINCELPLEFIKSAEHRIHDGTKVGWMLTGLIRDPLEEHIKFAGYGAEKFTNYAIMRAFAQVHPGIFFAINPGKLEENTNQKDALAIASTIGKLKTSDSGKCFLKNGNVWP